MMPLLTLDNNEPLIIIVSLSSQSSIQASMHVLKRFSRQQNFCINTAISPLEKKEALHTHINQTKNTTLASSSSWKNYYFKNLQRLLTHKERKNIYVYN